MTDVRLEGVTKTFPGRPPVRALREVDLHIAPGRVVAVLGPSGCGKTTLLRVVAGFERPDSGIVRLGDRVVAGQGREVPPERRHVGIVPQEGALFPHLDVAGNVGFSLRRLDRAARRARVGEMLELVGLAGYERRRPHELSGGQQQRVALARALAPRPAVVLLDEPFTALDAGLRARLRADLVAVLRQAEATAVIVTHDPEEALAVADDVAAMRSGRVVQVGRGPDLYRHPADIDTARLLGEVVVLPAEVRGAVACCALGEVVLDPCPTCPAPTTAGTVLLIRPEQIVADAASPVRALVEDIGYSGHDALIGLRLGAERLTARWTSLELPRKGESVGLRVVGTGCMVPQGAP